MNSIAQREPTTAQIAARPRFDDAAYDDALPSRRRPPRILEPPMLAVDTVAVAPPAPKPKRVKPPKGPKPPRRPSVADRVAFHLQNSDKKLTANEIVELVAQDSPGREPRALAHTTKCQLARIHAKGRLVVHREPGPLVQSGQRSMVYWADPAPE
jgi:hypothetical protein